jgi:NADPH:quinone reductase-like Zn-dependent oxidoreductase
LTSETKLLPARLPKILCAEYSGTIIAVGSSVTKFKAGDDVYGMSFDQGGAAEYMLLTNKYPFAIAIKPEGISHIEAASLPIAAMTSISTLNRAEKEVEGGLKGKTVLIPAGLGGVGCLMLPLAKNVYSVGNLITTVSTKKIALVPEILGKGVVDRIVDYTTQDVVKEIGKQTLDLMIDTKLLAFSYISLLKPHSGVLLTITGKSGKTLAKDFPKASWLLRCLMDAADSFFKWRARRWSVYYDHVYCPPRQEDLDTFSRYLAEGKVKPVIGRSAKMEDIETIRAMLGLLGNGGMGRYVIDME